MTTRQAWTIGVLVGACCTATGIVASAGVMTGNSTLIGSLDYSDSFTLTANGGISGRVANAFPVGLPGINVENNHGNPPGVWTNSQWSISSDATVSNGGTSYPGGSGAGSATGMTQRGGSGGDWGIDYGLQDDYVIQVDFVQTADRIDITTGAVRDTISNPGNISVFFRPPGGSNPQIGIYNPTGGVGEHDTGLASGIPAAGAWHNYAVRVKQSERILELYTDEVYRGSVDLDTVGGGVFAAIPLSNATVGTGYAGGDRGWSDNFQVGPAVLNPKGVEVGASTLISALDYSDSFTLTNKGGISGRTANTYPVPSTGLPVENAYGNPGRSWSSGKWSISNDANRSNGATIYPGPTDTGSSTGMTQRGSGSADWGIEYGLRRDFVVQTDMTQAGDRVNISVGGSRDTITPANGLSVFFRAAGNPGGSPQIGVYNGTTEVNTGLTSGVADSNEWHNYAVRFNLIRRELEFFVDETSRGSVKIDALGPGFHNRALSNGAVSVGFNYAGDDRNWSDNFQVGQSAAFQQELLSGFLEIDYSETFTINPPVRTDGLYNNNAGGGYQVEQAHGNPAATWTPLSNFSFNTPGSSTNPTLLNAAAGNPGAASGFAQSGGGDFSFDYGLRTSYVVSLDAILPSDRLDISSLPAPGADIFSPDSLSVFLRRDTVTGQPAIGLFDGTTETGVLLPGTLGISDNDWHNYAVWFNQDDDQLKVFVDRELVADLDLDLFAGGIYKDYSNAAVGAGGSGGVFWIDNFHVGIVPEPGTWLLLASTLACGLPVRRRKRSRLHS